MRELARESGLPASTLRFYVRKGLLPAPNKSAVNAALYGPEHLEGARILRDLRQRSPRVALAPLRRALTLVQQGVEPDVALSLQAKVFAPGLADDCNGLVPLRDFAQRLGVSEGEVEGLCAADILVPILMDGVPHFDPLDARIARIAFALEGQLPQARAHAARIAALIRQASGLEIELRNALVAGQSASAAAEASAQMQDWANVWHGYLFARFRVREVSVHGLGTTVHHEEPTL